MLYVMWLSVGKIASLVLYTCVIVYILLLNLEFPECELISVQEISIVYCMLCPLYVQLTPEWAGLLHL